MKAESRQIPQKLAARLEFFTEIVFDYIASSIVIDDYFRD